MRFTCHWSDNRNRLGDPSPITRCSVGLYLPFVEIQTRTKKEAQAIVNAFNSDSELGPETSGPHGAHIPKELLKRYGFTVPTN